uniref:Aminomethyltransferase n=1 Tax=Plectus sambesii TaxID=2011161 RepID=A0A914V5Q0_9BILA
MALLLKTCSAAVHRVSAQQCRFASRTCLFDFHKSKGGKMVDFAGWEMPVQYSDLSIADSTIHTRKHVSIFDVSHMLQSKIFGRDRIAFMESLIPADIEGLSNDQGTLSVFTNDKGGIRDDLITTKTSGDHLYVVTNAGCIDKDLPYMQTNAEQWRKDGRDVTVTPLHGRALIAVQGPEMVKLLQPQTDIDFSKLLFMHSAIGTVFGIPDCRVTRCGYTGEDGVEISMPPEKAAEFVEKLLTSSAAKAKMAGLGARDALRLEAGLCLYGNDIDEQTTPIEAGLAFVVAKKRRQTKGFPGADIIVGQLEKKNWPKKRVGLIAEGGRAPRGHLPLVDPMDSASVGFVTSGCPSPCLKKNIAMGYVDKSHSAVGRELLVDFGGKRISVKVAKMPFVPTQYYTGK